MASDLELAREAVEYFMERKGYDGLIPRDVQKLDGQPCWYFVYDLVGGSLEVEVEYRPEDGWAARVTTFSPA